MTTSTRSSARAPTAKYSTRPETGRGDPERRDRSSGDGDLADHALLTVTVDRAEPGVRPGLGQVDRELARLAALQDRAGLGAGWSVDGDRVRELTGVREVEGHAALGDLRRRRRDLELGELDGDRRAARGGGGARRGARRLLRRAGAGAGRRAAAAAAVVTPA